MKPTKAEKAKFKEYFTAAARGTAQTIRDLKAREYVNLIVKQQKPVHDIVAEKWEGWQHKVVAAGNHNVINAGFLKDGTDIYEYVPQVVLEGIVIKSIEQEIVMPLKFTEKRLAQLRKANIEELVLNLIA